MEMIESDTYWCLTLLLSPLQTHYTANQPGLQLLTHTLTTITSRTSAPLHSHLEANGVNVMQFSFRWFNCLMVREFTALTVCRLWDTCLSEDGGFQSFLAYVCSSLLAHFGKEIVGMDDVGDLFGFLQELPTKGWGEEEVAVLVGQAFILKR